MTDFNKHYYPSWTDEDIRRMTLTNMAIELSDRDFEALVEMLESPPEPNKELMKLMEESNDG